MTMYPERNFKLDEIDEEDDIEDYNCDDEDIEIVIDFDDDEEE